MAKLVDTSVSLCFYGDDLNPDALTQLLGITPSRSGRKDEFVVRKTGNSHMVKTGYWRLQSEDSLSGDMDWQLTDLFGRMSDDLRVWRELSLSYNGEIFFGWFLTSSNDMANISAQTIQHCAARGLSLSFDVYDFIEEHGENSN